MTIYTKFLITPNTPKIYNIIIKFNIFQWNCRSILTKFSELQILLERNNIHVACLCETWLKDDLNISIRNYNIMYENRNRQGGSVAILIREHIQFKRLNLNYLENLCRTYQIEFIAVQLYILVDKNTPEQFSSPFYYKRINIISLYSPPRINNNHTDNDFWNQFFIECDKLTEHTIISGDLNGKSPTWSSLHSLSNPEGDRIEQTLLRSTYTCLNDGSFTWSSQDLSVRSSLDVAFISPILATNCIWYVLDYNYGSDHFPIIISFSLNISKKIGCRPHINMNKINWLSFKNALECYLDDTIPINTNQALQIYNSLTDNIYCLQQVRK